MVDGWHCLFLKLNKICTSISGKARIGAQLTSEPAKRVRAFERNSAHRIPEPSIIFRKYQLSQRLA
ncbi:hypothetical protein E2P84_40495 [Burkholderia cepacia]|uniref:Uncharacterized protein n=2 Tax=Burkholderia TaxID=32008 RepID=A0AAQ0JFD6_BURCE|nr:hypothetical protein CEQ23_11040 [Burkholderia cepacia]MBB0213496.1 hypothetical protein [Ralstonia pickettii]MCR5896506.1 hypothetical protein [Burkholderia sp. HAN2018]OUE40791.1 hypothetical protein BZY94_26665 [Burkholderia territorii]QCY01922.1 hypothetical protein EJ998_01585 [Burkholderia cepacia ATCC 25416]RBB37004.1 hypothetical protein DPV79_22985 [Burkholderia reimsis]